jgi:23S rRNA (cytidine1920-2'-O)/16S rRNA (cytidine1409-2'-O)-methyltransferase
VLIALVKPQFEVGPQFVEKGGVVRDAAARADAISGIEQFVLAQGLSVVGVMDSTLPGPAGNVEALLVARRGP